MDVVDIISTFQIISTALFMALKLRRKRRWRTRRWWVHPINQARERKGHFQNLIQELKKDEERFFKYTRMDFARFENLLNLLKPSLKKCSNRKPICPEQRLIITLRYLATGDEMSSIALAFRLGESTTRQIIKETCSAISNILRPLYVAVPTREEWLNISKGFLENWNLPYCLGAVDGKHIVIQAPPNSGSQFLNYKKTFSIVLMAICDYDYNFTLFDMGSDGGQNDAGIFNDTWFGKDLYNKGEELNFPQGTGTLPGTDIKVPWYFVGDAAFTLSPHLMKPYPGMSLTENKKIFNYRLSRGRRVIENAFGILSARWRVLRKRLSAEPKTVDAIVMACVCLHNYLKKLDKSDKKLYCPPGFADTETNGEITPGEWRDGIQNNFNTIGNIGAHRSTQTAYGIRDILAEYFASENGMVPWQYDYIRQGTNRNII